MLKSYRFVRRLLETGFMRLRNAYHRVLIPTYNRRSVIMKECYSLSSRIV